MTEGKFDLAAFEKKMVDKMRSPRRAAATPQQASPEAKRRILEQLRNTRRLRQAKPLRLGEIRGG